MHNNTGVCSKWPSLQPLHCWCCSTRLMYLCHGAILFWCDSAQIRVSCDLSRYINLVVVVTFYSTVGLAEFCIMAMIFLVVVYIARQGLMVHMTYLTDRQAGKDLLSCGGWIHIVSGTSLRSAVWLFVNLASSTVTTVRWMPHDRIITLCINSITCTFNK